MLENVWVIPAIPFATFWGILFFGKRLPHKGAELGIGALSLCFALSLVTGAAWIDRVDNPPVSDHTTEQATEHATGGSEIDGTEHAQVAGGDSGTGIGVLGAAAIEEAEEHIAVDAVVQQWTWWQNGGIEFTVGTMVDGLTAMMLLVVTVVSLLVHIYSTDYVGGDRRYTHFFAFLSLFSASMLMLVMAENTLQMIVGWELVGLCSFVLIGHWWEEKPNSDAALKAFLTNRVGDIGMLIGVITLFFAANQTWSIVEINSMANAGQISHTALLVASLCLTAAVMSKSGQFFLHTWLPDAMAGPTPVSALIHAATMVVAGVFMVARLYGVFWDGFSIGTSNINVLAVVGGFTTIVGGVLAFVQADIKKVLAYSTISQLGYMVMALGVGAWTAGLFHLFTHAFFKACLFLGSGSVSHAVHSFDMVKDMGGMRKWMPHTFRTFMIGSIALAGIPPLAGFWSKDEILAGASQLGGGGDGYPVVLVMGFITAGLTAAYMTRCVYLTFFGEYRGHTPVEKLHESGPRITLPLWILAGLAIVAGLANLPGDSIVPDGWALRFEHFVEPTGAYFPAISHPHFSGLTALVSIAVAGLGVAIGYAFYFRQLGPHGLTQRSTVAKAGYTFLENRYYLDHLYTGVIAGGTKGPIARAAYWTNQNIIDGIVNGVGISARRIGLWVYDKIDQGIVDGTVNGLGLGAGAGGEVLRETQTGRVQQYASVLFGSTLVLALVIALVIV
ncbi:MAG TPA: NADH-quinone oxidoreductase subunit L [Acidimicrobiales bacterium]